MKHTLKNHLLKSIIYFSLKLNKTANINKTLVELGIKETFLNLGKSYQESIRML